MNLDIAVLLPWILVLLIIPVAVVFWLTAARKQQARIEALTAELRTRDETLRAREETLERFAVQALPSVTEAVRRLEPATAPVDVQVGLDDSRFGQCLRWIAERHADDLRLVQSEVREQTNREAEERIRLEVKTAEEAVRAEVSTASRDATSAAVRSFGTSVVSLGADVGQVVSAVLREHRDDEVYATLTRIDHTVQQMIRQAQSYVIVCGGLPGRRWPAQSLTDVVGGATGRVRDYLRVRTNQLDRVVISRAVEPLVHTLATLLDNALRYSPPTSYVDISFQEGHHGVTVIVDDAGVRMNAEQMEEARQVLANERPVDIHQLGPSPKVGFPGIAALARRYGFTVYIDGPNAYGGMRAMVYIPEALLVAPRAHDELVAPAKPVPAPKPAAVQVVSETPVEEKEFALHEITSGGLPKRRRKDVAPPAPSAPRVVGPGTEPGLARADIAAAWHSGSKSGRAAVADNTASDNTEGMTS